MSGETSDISKFCELEWYEWIVFRELVVKLPEDTTVPGIYLVPSINFGPAMTAKIMKSNVEVVNRLTYRALLPEEMDITEQKSAWEAFYASVAIKCGPGATVEDFDDLGAVETLEYDLYKDYTMDGSCPKAPHK